MKRKDDEFELELESIANSGKFSKAYACELTDRRMSAETKIVLFYIRYRTYAGASGGLGKAPFVSCGRMARELGMSLRTLMRHLAEIKKMGVLVCKSRGYGRSKSKVLLSTHRIYDPMLYMRFDEFISGECTEEKIRRLGSLDWGKDGPVSRSALDADTCNEGHEQPVDKSGSMYATDGTSSMPRMAQTNSYAKNGTSELEEADEDEIEEDPRFARSEPGYAEVRTPQAPGEPGLVVEDQDTSPSGQGPRATAREPRPTASAPRGEETAPRSDQGSSREDDGISLARDTLVPLRERDELGRVGEGVDTSADESDSDGPRTPAEIEAARRRDQARSLASSAGRRAKEKGETQLRRKAAKKARQAASGEAAVLAKKKAAEKKARQTPGSKLHDHCKVSFERWFPDVPWGKWLTQERSQAKQLLDVYGGDLDLITKCWDFSCENWDHLKKKLKLDTSYPTIGWLFGYRGRIIPMVQDVKANISEIMDDSDKGMFEA